MRTSRPDLELLARFRRRVCSCTGETSSGGLDAIFADASVKRSRGGWAVSATLSNTGSRAGAEVVQLYISALEPSVSRPSKELKGFEKVYLRPGEKKRVSFTLSPEDISRFDAEGHRWVADPGEYKALLGCSSADIRTSVSFRYGK